MEIKELTKSDFLKLVNNFEENKGGWSFNGERPCLVDFHAPWCGYCKALNPILDTLSDEYEGKVDFYKVDVDKEEDLEKEFNIRTIPTLFFAKKEESKLMLGVMSKQELKQKIEQILLD